jgi:signal transduction histidine kinase
VRRRLVLSYVVLAAVLLIVLEVPLGILGANQQRDAVRASARRDAAVLAALAGPGLDPAASRQGPDLDDLSARYATETGAEVTIVDRNGRTVAYHPPASEGGQPDSDRDGTTAALHGALAGATVVATRKDEGHSVEVAAVPITAKDGTVTGAVQVALPAAAAEHRIHVLVAVLLAFAGIALAVVAGVGMLVARSVVRPLGDLETAVRALEAGDLDARTEPSGPPELRSLGVSFNRMAARLDELITSQRRFIADASHQLRSPLAALRLRLEAVAVADPESGQRHLEAAVEEVGRLSRLVDGLLELARVEGTRPERSVVDVTVVLRDRVDTWEALAGERGVRLDLAATDGDLRAIAVPGHLEQIVDNLLANAVEVAPSGSVIDLGAAVRAVDGRSALEVDVDDAGPGMTEDQRQVAFTRFWQDDSQPTGTTGLGLAISRQLARTSGGELTLGVSPAGGLRATIVLEPAADAGAPIA